MLLFHNSGLGRLGSADRHPSVPTYVMRQTHSSASLDIMAVVAGDVDRRSAVVSFALDRLWIDHAYPSTAAVQAR